jgi:hypothetical protein
MRALWDSHSWLSAVGVLKLQWTAKSGCLTTA